MTHDDVAKALGAGSWSELLIRFEAGEQVPLPRGSLKLVGEAWDEMRLRLDLVQVRRGLDFIAGRRCAFTAADLADDLRFADMPNTYDDPAMPVACPREKATLARMVEESSNSSIELREGRKHIAILLAIIAAVVLGLSIRLSAVPVVALPLLLFGLWASGMAWLQFGDFRQEETGQQPAWSMRRSVLAHCLPLHWFGPDHR